MSSFSGVDPITTGTHGSVGGRSPEIDCLNNVSSQER